MDYSWIGVTRAHMSDDTMMRSSNALLNRWSNKQHKSGNGPSSPWIHPPGALQGAHVAYLVKFLGCTEVESAKGIEVVKAGIQKMRFNSHLKRSEGSKIPKMELTISIDGVAIQEPKTKRILYQYPLYRISYCADDKAEKRFFCFIAKEENPSAEQTQHRCFVFVSDRLAENITLTIGQAFDLAYRRFLETSGREMEMRKQILILQKRARLLERENADLKLRVVQLESSGHRVTTDIIKLSDDSEPTITTVPFLHSTSVNGCANGSNAAAANTTNDLQCNRNGFGHNSYASAPTLAVRQQHRVEIAPPPPLPPRPLNGEATNGHGDGKSDLITLDPFAVTISPEEDPFGDFQKLFATNSAGGAGSDKLYDEAIGRMDKRMSEMKADLANLFWPIRRGSIARLEFFSWVSHSNYTVGKIIVLPEEDPIVAQPAFMFHPGMAHEIDEQEKHAAAAKIQAKYREYKARKDSQMHKDQTRKVDGDLEPAPSPKPADQRDPSSRTAKPSSASGSKPSAV